MGVELDEKLVDQIVGQVKTQDDLADLSQQLPKAAVERVIAAEWNITWVFQALS